jgi:FtsH-binding integral membrane protein
VQDWNNLVGLALYGTAGMTLLTAVAVMMLDINFSFLGWGLFVALLGLVVIGLLNILFFKNPLVRLIGSYIGAVVFLTLLALRF